MQEDLRNSLYAERKYGLMTFVSGGVLVGDTVQIDGSRVESSCSRSPNDLERQEEDFATTDRDANPAKNKKRKVLEDIDDDRYPSQHKKRANREKSVKGTGTSSQEVTEQCERHEGSRNIKESVTKHSRLTSIVLPQTSTGPGDEEERRRRKAERKVGKAAGLRSEIATSASTTSDEKEEQRRRKAERRARRVLATTNEGSLQPEESGPPKSPSTLASSERTWRRKLGTKNGKTEISTTSLQSQGSTSQLAATTESGSETEKVERKRQRSEKKLGKKRRELGRVASGENRTTARERRVMILRQPEVVRTRRRTAGHRRRNTVSLEEGML